MTFATPTWRPGNLTEIRNDHEFRKAVDDALQRIYTTASVNDSTGIAAATVGGAFNVAHGKVSVTGSKLGIPTGLAQVTNAVASIDNGSIATNFTVSTTPSVATTGAIDIYVWMPTGAGNTTPIAATSAITIRWWAMGSTVSPTSSGA